MWKGTEDELDFGQRRIFGSDERECAFPKAHALSALVIRRCEGQTHRGMPLDQSTELAASVPARPEYAHWNSIHHECIIIHSLHVNSIQTVAKEQAFPCP